jgi:hypothetical protein
MTKSQEKAVAAFRAWMERNLDKNPAYGATITEFVVEPTNYGTYWIKAQTELLGLSEGNLLRALSHEYWLVAVGKNGGLTARIVPKPFEQFKGRRGHRVHGLFQVR